MVLFVRDDIIDGDFTLSFKNLWKTKIYYKLSEVFELIEASTRIKDVRLAEVKDVRNGPGVIE